MPARGTERRPPRLIALSPGDLDPAGTAAFLATLERALEAGLPGFLLREPRASDRAYLALARLAAAACRSAGCWFAVHDRAHLAAALAADAVHLSFRSLGPAELRPWLDARIALGLSTHAGDDPRGWEAADYVFHGPLHATTGKARPQTPVGHAGLARAARASVCPLLALGGVTPADIPELAAVGVHGVAVLAGLLGAADPAQATRAFLAALAEAPSAERDAGSG